MSETLDELAVKLCENLPEDFTIYEENGLCKKPNIVCKYCRKNGDSAHSCNKKTYTFIGESVVV